jgi:hypothetical protein
MSKTKIPPKIITRLWVKAAGRCQYKGCNKLLLRDDITQADLNAAYIAHIIADRAGGPRGDHQLSETLKSDITNLMLMCDPHHRLIDKEDVQGHPPTLLKKMKEKHESRIELLTSIQEERQSAVILYGANIGQHSCPLDWKMAATAMAPEWYPAERNAIEIGLKNSTLQDHESEYWVNERNHLKQRYNERVKQRLENGESLHFSVFAIAPQPLLIKLGTLLSDINRVEVYQLQKEPQTWKWQQDKSSQLEYIIHEPLTQYPTVAINLSLSGTITQDRINDVLGSDVSIWTLTIQNPNNDFLKTREQLSLFRQTFRELLNRVKAIHGQDALLHIFPACPVAIAIEIGRVRMPKVDMPYRLYDQNHILNGFSFAFDIGVEERRVV